MSNETQLNRDINGNATVINRELQSNETVLNDQVISGGEVREGTVICGKYTVISRLDVAAGEAGLYLCEFDGTGYIAKIYRRKAAVKADVLEKLAQIDSPYVARVYETGEADGYPVEILYYYKYGSLQGKRYDIDRLRNEIIPSLNEGLHILHENGIIHKDLKPSNIMLADNQRDVAIIDFGISSIREQGNTVVVTRTGMTPEYSAPETFKNLFLTESDYYSLGITVFELFCGYTPYNSMDPEEIEQYVSVQRLPFPDTMPDELKDFITAVTFPDIRNRKNKSNPNRRWGYEEVRNWCDGIAQTIPGESINSTGNMRPYPFLGTVYTVREELIQAMAKNWAEGKKHLFRGLLSEFFKTFDAETAGYCIEAENEATKINGKDDLIFARTLYRINPGSRAFYWQGAVYQGLPALGRELLERLWSGETGSYQYYDSILLNDMLSTYVISKEPQNKKMIAAVRGLETAHSVRRLSRSDKLRNYYMMAYMLSGQKLMRLGRQDFRTVGELTACMKELLQDSYVSFEAFCHQLIDYDGVLNPQFESWLLALGKHEELKRWRENLTRQLQ